MEITPSVVHVYVKYDSIHEDWTCWGILHAAKIEFFIMEKEDDFFDIEFRFEESVIDPDSLPKTVLAEDYKKIMSVVKQNRLIADRISKLTEMGYSVSEFPMGSGGVGQIREMSGTIRIQISYGHGRHNYAHAVELEKM